MTRKCALCKETNYKNNYSFFSAPKDPETRKKWQIALAIKNYAVTDDTYVCSKHFHKNDIITHWVSGVPPRVIKIKYKKCRLRPGAVPGRNFHSVSSSQMNEDVSNRCDVYDFLTFKKKQVLDLLEDDDTFLIPRKEKNLNDNEYKDSRNSNTCYQTYSKLQDSVHNYEENCKGNLESDNIYLLENMNKKDMDILVYDSELEKSRFEKKEPDKTLGSNNSHNLVVFTEAVAESVDTNRKESQIQNKLSLVESLNKMENNIEKYDSSEEDRTSIETCKHNHVLANTYLKKSVHNRMIDDLYIDNHVLTALNYDHVDTQNRLLYDDFSESEILFEDFLEVYTEVPIPRGWSCLVTSKGHGTTVVYLCMNITTDGLPFVEKQIFLRSDMMLHYIVANREIDPFVHNLIKEGKHIKVRSLLDIEEFIDEFGRRIVCQGICDLRDYEGTDMMKVAYKDGIKWRHTSCPLILNNDSSKCTKCTILSRMLIHKSQKSFPFSYNITRRRLLTSVSTQT